MTIRHIIVLSILCCLSCAQTAQIAPGESTLPERSLPDRSLLEQTSTPRLLFNAEGFAIDQLEAKSGNGAYTPLIMALPPAGEVSPNVNVMIQHYEASIEDYQNLSLYQFEQARFQVHLNERIDDATARFEYEGEMHGRQWRWYAIAIKSGDKIYLVTATASPEQWHTYSERLKKCVESFEILP